MRDRSGQTVEALESILEATAAATGFALAPQARLSLARYACRVLQWNRTANLTGARDAGDFCRRFLGDVFVVAPLIAGERLVDVGSGNGLPGLALAVLKPSTRVWLVEPRARRARFLDRKSTRLNSVTSRSRMPSSA